MTTHFQTRLLPLAIAGLLLAGCAVHRTAVADAESAAADAGTAREATPSPAPPAPPAPPASVGLAAPATAARASATTLDSVSVSGSRIRASAEAKAIAPGEPGRGDVRQQAQSGILTAGDVDDLLNPGQYARYAERYLQGRTQTAPAFVDTRSPLQVRVLGTNGQPVAFADVSVSDGRGRTLHLPTAANGSTVFFPSLDGLAGRLQLAVDAGGLHAIRRSVNLDRLGANRTISITLPIAGRAPQALDLVLAIDTTGSMGDELDYLQAELDSIVASLRRIRPGTDIRVGLVVYRDAGDEYVTRRFELTRDLADLRQHLGAQQASGGGDYPEAVDRAFVEAGRFDWRGNATKVLLHVADAPPHAEHAGAAWEQALKLRTRGVHIVPVAASGVADDAQYLMRSMAAVTQGRYLFLTDDSGVGLPHDEPDVPCYMVTRLDGLIERVVASLLLGRRVEPRDGDILRRTGDYDRGICKTAKQPRIAQ